MAEEVYKEEAKTVEELQAEIAALKQELADVKAQSQSTEEAAASVVKAMEQSTEDKDVKVEMLCRWAAARAGAIVIAPLVGTVALMANEVYLVSRIARVYDVKLSERALIAFLGAVGSRDDDHSFQRHPGPGCRWHHVQPGPRYPALAERRHAYRHGSLHRHDGRMEG